MQGKENVIATLNKLLTGELTSMDVYFLHSRMFKNWGLDKLHDQFQHELTEETEHAAALIERILFLEGAPDLVSREAFKVGSNVRDMLQIDLEMEYEVAKNLKAAIKLCESESDYVTREVLQKLLYDTEEDHIDWLETNLGLIEKIGIENYRQSMMASGSPG